MLKLNQIQKCRFVWFCIILLFLIILLRLIHIYNKSRYYVSSNNNGVYKDKKHFSRLPIVDRNGNHLAYNIMTSNLYLLRSKMIDPIEDIKKIRQIINPNKTDQELLNGLISLENNKNSMLFIQNDITNEEKDQLIKNGVLGIHFEEVEKRIYTQDNNFLHIIGAISQDGQGLFGLEKSMNNYLNYTMNEEPLILSVDSVIQNIVRNALLDKMLETKSKSASGIIMNIQTGEIISAVSLPDCNPNNLNKCGNNDLFNRFSLAVYELGSVFKVFLAALAFDNNISKDKLYDRRAYTIDKWTIHDIDKKEQIGGKISLFDTIKISSNVGSVAMMYDIGPIKQRNFFAKIGLLEKIMTELPEIGKPLYSNTWSMVNSIVMSYGHGIAISPLHFITSASSLLGNHKLNPTFLKTNEKIIGSKILSDKALQNLKETLRAVIQEGSGKRAYINNYDVGGKTGTAIQQVNGQYDRDKMILTFFMALPIEDPEYAFFIMLEEPKVTSENRLYIRGANVLAPLIKNIISIVGPLLNIKTQY